MYKRILTSFFCMACLVQTIFWNGETVLASEPPKETELYAKGAVLMDADSGRILYEKNGSQALANASTTKILTCILALENCDLNDSVTISANAASQPKVRLGVREGQVFYLKDLLYGLMLESYNDCAVAIAEYIAGTTEDFSDMMNDKAEEIGCTDSHFITPNGLDATDQDDFHHTTAADLAGIMRYCIKTSEKSEEFLEITGTSQYSFQDVQGKSNYNCYNHNAFLQMMEGAISGKTGFTGTAGYCYVGALKRDDRTYIVALLACGWPNNKSYKWSDTKKLMQYGIDNFIKKDLKEMLPDMARIKPVEVVEGQGNTIGEKAWVTPVLQEGEGTEKLLLGPDEEIALKYELTESLQAPVKKGAYLGKVSYLLGDIVLKEYNITAENSVEKIDYAWCFTQILHYLCL